MTVFEITIPASGNVRFPSLQAQPQTLVLSVSGSNVVRVGDVSTSSTVGIVLQPKTVTVIPLGQDYSTRTNEWYAAGTSGDVLDVMVL
jgi:hypothetical protein